MIDLPQLMGRLKLVAHRDGKKVIDKMVDSDTIDLLTKRFIARRTIAIYRKERSTN